MSPIKSEIISKVIKKRPNESYKGMYGNVLIIGGNQNMGGAAIMSGSAAVHSGAGLVTIATDKTNIAAIHAALPEAMFINYCEIKSLIEHLTDADVIVIGPGLGIDETAFNILNNVLMNIKKHQILIIDGSAITLISKHKKLLNEILDLQIIFTPHQMEWQRLSGIKIEEQTEQKNQLAQEKLDATVIVKKFHTEIYFKNKITRKLLVGGPYMSTGGMGDTLTGIIAGFLAQFKNEKFEDVIQAAVYTHSKIAEIISNDKYVVLPSDIISNIQSFMRQHES